jgi:uncharacterized repeat protein (TIGR01451 family)
MFQAKTKRLQNSASKTLSNRANPRRSFSRRLRLESLEPRMMLTATPGTWTALAHLAPTSHIGTMQLLSDGTMLASAQSVSIGNTWFKLTPDSTGSYVNGAWSQAASASVNRFYDAENVLQDGRVFVLGGEYNVRLGPQVWTNTGAIYNPITNSWTPIPNFPESTFGGPTELLPDGRILAGSMTGPNTYIFDPAANSWSNGPTKLFNDSSQFETWTKLPDGSILSYGIWAGSTEAQRLNTSTMTWVDAGTVPVALQTTAPRIGPAMLLPDGRVFQVGGNSNTALYDPATNTWAAGPVIPGGLGGNVASAAMLPNGHVLFGASATPAYGGPTHIFEFDPTDNSLVDVTPAPPNLASTPSYESRMLVLPSGQVLFTSALPSANSQLYVYTPSGSSQAAWQPTISAVADNGDGTFTLTGTQLNGLSAGASYGSPAEMDSNYPLVELQATDGSGNVYFARTFNWSSTGVATGSTSVSTEFATAAFMPYGTYNLSVVANGIASAPVSFTGGVVGPSADLAVTNNGPTTSIEGSNVTYNLTVTNNGPTTATNVVLTDTLGSNLNYVAATNSQGTFTHGGSVVTFSFGSIGVGQTVTATVTAQSTEDGNLTNSASVTSSLPDANSNNNSAVATTAVTEPAVVVSAPIQVSGKNQNNVTVATFTHASGVEAASTFTATIKWGDNSTSQGTITQSGTTYSVKGSHNYAQNGSHTVTTTVVESDTMSPHFAMASLSTGKTATPTASAGATFAGSTSSTPSDSKGARDAILATTAGFGASIAPWSSKVNLAGAEPIVDADSLDALFGSLGSSDVDSLRVRRQSL